MRLFKYFVIKNRSDSIRLITSLTIITAIIFCLKLFWVPLYWPGGDYLNHLQNAYGIIARVHSSFAQYQANAWWQPIGPSLYLLIIGTPFIKSFYPFLIIQSFMIALIAVFIYRLSSPISLQSRIVSFLLSIILLPGLFFHIDNPAHVGNFLFQTVALCLLLAELGGRRLETRYLVVAALSLVLANAFRSSGFVIVFCYLLYLLIRDRNFNFFDRRHKIFILVYIVFNLLFSIPGTGRNFDPERKMGLSSCYAKFSQDVLDKTIATSFPDMQTAGNINFSRTFPIQDTFSKKELDLYLVKSPNFTTFKYAIANGYDCTGSKNSRISGFDIFKMAFFGSSPPRDGRQLMITVQSLATRIQAGTFPISLMFKEELIEATEKIYVQRDKYSLSFASVFVLNGYPKFFDDALRPFIIQTIMVNNPEVKVEEIYETRMRALFGAPSPWAKAHAFTMLEGHVFTALSAIAGPTVQNQIYRDTFSNVIKDEPIISLLFLENLYCNFLYHFSLTNHIKSCNPVSIDGYLASPPRVNVRAGLPERMGSELASNNVLIETHQNVLDLLRVYISTIPILAAISICCILVGLFLILFRPSPAVYPIFFILLIFIIKIGFYGSLGGTGDYARYSDEGRLLFVIFAAYLLSLFQFKKTILN
jgi:hypothetical protein